ncbi:MAG: Gfo/Idh/MocA family oxidoreductase [Ignavibacteriaceae bacterium]|jgi:predicted dehydrogenase|nr:Gfo/Idh/MocA family oxidoreductase [Ignavibacteriaceae bacterium]
MVEKLYKGKKVKWGVAGCGRFAENNFLPVTKLLRKSSVISLYSRDINRSKYLSQKFGVQNYFDNYDEFLKSYINAVFISSPNAHHYEQVIKAARAGKNILCEKPLALSSVQAEEMVRVCKENNVLFSVNYTHRFHPLIKKAKELILDQKLGKLVSIDIKFNIDFPPDDNFRFKKELSGGGALRDIGTHVLDLLIYFGGKVESIDGYMGNLIYNSEVDDFAIGTVKFSKSGFGTFNVSYNNKKAFNRIEILCHKGAIAIDNLIGRKIAAPKLTILLEDETRKSFRKRGNKMLYVLKSVQKSFLKNETPFVTGEDGLINLKLLEELERKCLQRKS